MKKPTPKAKAGQPVESLDVATKPKKVTASQKAPKKAKAVSPKALTKAVEASTLKHAGLSSGNVWPNWVRKLAHGHRT